MAGSAGGAPLGNNNPAKGKSFQGALRRALYDAGTDRERLIAIAEALVIKAEAGDILAIREIADRLDGKPTQMIGSDPETPVLMKWARPSE